VLVTLAKEVERLGHRHLPMFEGHVAFGHRPHALLDAREILVGERSREIEVVVEAVRDGRTEPELRVGKELQDRTGHDVRGRVPERVERFVAVVGFAFRLGHRCSPLVQTKRPSSSYFWDESPGSRGSTRIPPRGGTHIRGTGRTHVARRRSLLSIDRPARTLSGSLNGPALEGCPRRRGAQMIAGDWAGLDAALTAAPATGHPGARRSRGSMPGPSRPQSAGTFNERSVI